MKIKQSLIIGILFLVVFVGAMLFAMAIGRWNPAGIGVTHSEGGEHEGEESKLPELHGETNLQEWCAFNKIPADCVAGKLGLTAEQLNKPARDIASSIGRQTYELVVMFEECLKMGGKPDYEEKAEEKKDAANRPKHEEKTEVTEPAKEGHSEEKAENEPEESESSSDLPFLKGTDNVLEYLKTNRINIECVSRTLGLSENDLDKTAKEVAALVGQEHVEYIREVIAKCK